MPKKTTKPQFSEDTRKSILRLAAFSVKNKDIDDWREFNDDLRYYPESHMVSRTFTLFNAVPGTKYYLQVYGVLNSSLINIAVTKPSMTYMLVR